MLKLQTPRMLHALAAVALLAGTACSSDESAKSAPPAASETSTTTSTMAPTPPRGSGVFEDELIEMEATIQSIDKVNRRVTLRDDNGKLTTIKAPADADLNRINVGERVGISYYQSMAINLADPTTPLGAAGSTATVKTAPGETPGRAAGETITVKAQVVGIDLGNNTVTFRNSEGQVSTVAVRDPDLQRRLKNLKLGDVLVFTFAEAVAVAIIPQS
jgi:hypothetical protein